MNTNLTEIIFLLDRSGSMGGLENDTIGGFNAFIEKQKKMPGETIVTTVLFDDRYEILWNGVDVKDIKLTEKEYYVRGMTALLDAIGKTILDVNNRLSITEESRRPGKVIFVITTDGMENASKEFTYEKVRELIKQQTEKHNWEFIFLGASIDAVKEAGSIGVNRKDAYNFEASPEGVKRMYNVVCEEVKKRRENL
ncbi:MAG: VWA domain-containing protein [Clostridiaceae bacterium]|nr:VWA domain-containing protein [Clostridiaceae bacterium]